MERLEALKSIFSGEVLKGNDEIESLLQTLKKGTSWDGGALCEYKGFWLRTIALRPIIRSQRNFKAHNTDIMLCALPKCGTTWLKALTFSIMNRNTYRIRDPIHPLLISNPHGLVPFLEINIYGVHEDPNLESIPSPRIFSTHMPYQLLPDTILHSDCRIIYICRNPLDHFISHRQFVLGNMDEEYKDHFPLDDSFDKFCRGVHPYGPFCDHVRGYQDAHLENPRKVLFLKYEDLKEDITSHVKIIAEFLGMPFSPEEEEQGMMQQIAKLCSFENLRDLEVNKTGISNRMIKNSSYFRNGHVGDWANYLTPAMAKRFENIVESKFDGSGLKFQFSSDD